MQKRQSGHPAWCKFIQFGPFLYFRLIDIFTAVRGPLRYKHRGHVRGLKKPAKVVRPTKCPVCRLDPPFLPGPVPADVVDAEPVPVRVVVAGGVPAGHRLAVPHHVGGEAARGSETLGKVGGANIALEFGIIIFTCTWEELVRGLKTCVQKATSLQQTLIII